MNQDQNMTNPEQKSHTTATGHSVAISVKNVSKQFSIPHEKTNTLKGAFINLFRKNTYEKFFALKDVSFEVRKGEFFGILGRNGSGKSTLLKILAGVYTANQGSVHIHGLISPFLELGIGFNPFRPRQYLFERHRSRPLRAGDRRQVRFNRGFLRARAIHRPEGQELFQRYECEVGFCCGHTCE